MEHSLVATSLVRYWRDLEATWSLTIPTGAGPPRQAVALRGRDLLQPQGTAHKGSEGWRRWLRPQPPAGCGSRGPCGRVGAGRLGSHAIQLSNPHILVHGAGRQRTRTGARRVRRQLRGTRGSTSKAPAARQGAPARRQRLRSAPRWRRGDRSRAGPVRARGSVPTIAWLRRLGAPPGESRRRVDQGAAAGAVSDGGLGPRARVGAGASRARAARGTAAAGTSESSAAPAGSWEASRAEGARPWLGVTCDANH